jgi:Sigma-70 region 2
MSDFGQMLGREISRLRRYARALTRDSVRADDLVQSTLERALAKSHLWQPGTNLRHWLFTILHNQRVSEVRQLVREQRALADERVGALSPAASDPTSGIALLELDRAIAALPGSSASGRVADRPRRNVLRRSRRHPGGAGRYGPIPARTRAREPAQDLPYRSADCEIRLAGR